MYQYYAAHNTETPPTIRIVMGYIYASVIHYIGGILQFELHRTYGSSTTKRDNKRGTIPQKKRIYHQVMRRIKRSRKKRYSMDDKAVADVMCELCILQSLLDTCRCTDRWNNTTSPDMDTKSL
eukprot:959050_1